MGQSVSVKICTGTACYVMGGANLLMLEECLPEHLKGRIEIEGTSCMGYCSLGEKGKAPFVMINDQLISEATLEKITEKIKTMLE